MRNRYRPYRRGIRFFPHIIPIGFPLIFPFGIGLAFWLFHAVFSLLGILLLVALAFFIIRAITLGSPGAAWDSMRNMGNQWQQRFTSQNQQSPYQQPSYRPTGQSNDFDQPRTQYPEQTPPMQQ